MVPLLSVADDADEGVRINAARGLALFPAPHRAAAREALGQRLRDESELVRIAASWGLVELGDHSAAPAPGLVNAVMRYGGIPAPFRYYLRPKHSLGGGRRRFGGMVMSLCEAPQAMLSLGADAIPVLEAAATRLESPRRVMLVYALAGMGKAGIRPLERLLSGPDPLLRNVAACCLGLFGAKGQAAVPLLVQLASRHDPYEAIIVEAGEDVFAEIVEEGLDLDLLGATSWVRESHGALLAIGAPALPALRAAGAADPEVAKRLAPLITAIVASADDLPPR